MLSDALLWEVKSESVSHSSYIFGTIHLKCPSLAQFIAGLEEVSNKVDVIFTETKLNQSVAASNYEISDGQTLLDLIGVKKYMKIKKIFNKAFDFDLDAHNRLLPLLVAQNLALISQDVQNSPSLDLEIFRLAMRKQLKYSGIETIEEQLTILSKIPIEYQLKALLKIAKNIGSFRKKLNQLIQMYEDQRIGQLHQSSKKQLGKIRNLLLKDRNYLIAERIGNLHKVEASLFTFGAGHLAGKNGVLALLKRNGHYLYPKSLLLT